MESWTVILWIKRVGRAKAFPTEWWSQSVWDGRSIPGLSHWLPTKHTVLVAKSVYQKMKSEWVDNEWVREGGYQSRHFPWSTFPCAIRRDCFWVMPRIMGCRFCQVAGWGRFMEVGRHFFLVSSVSFLKIFFSIKVYRKMSFAQNDLKSGFQRPPLSLHTGPIMCLIGTMKSCRYLTTVLVSS